MVSYYVLLPLAAVILLNLVYVKFVREQAALLSASIPLILLGWIISFQILRLHGKSHWFPAAMQVDGLGTLFLIIIALITFLVLIFGHASIPAPRRFAFANLLLLSMAAMCGVVTAGDIFSVYVFLEAVAISSFILIAFNRDKEPLEGSFKYLLLSSVATMLLLLAIAVLMMLTGATSFTAIKSAYLASHTPQLFMLAAGLFLAATFIKSGMMPFHGWVPDAYTAAPNSVSVLLAGIVTKVSGLYLLFRFFLTIFPMNAQISKSFLVIGLISAVLGAILAMSQHNIKRMLAYSSISQMGYILLGLAVNTPLGIAGALFHLFNHAIFKSQLFLNAAAIEDRTGTLDMRELGGLGEKMPYTSAMSIVAFFSTAGIPPLAGFWSKLIIILALWNTSHHIAAGIALAASLLTIGYFLILQRNVFFGKIIPSLTQVTEAGVGFTLPSFVLTAITVVTGLLFPLSVNGLMGFVHHILLR